MREGSGCCAFFTLFRVKKKPMMEMGVKSLLELHFNVGISR